MSRANIDQTAFSRVLKVIRKQCRPCIDLNGDPRYRTSRNRSPGGILIPSKRYTVLLEKLDLDKFSELFHPDLNFHLILDMQKLHNNLCHLPDHLFSCEFDVNMGDIAKLYGLKYECKYAY